MEQTGERLESNIRKANLEDIDAIKPVLEQWVRNNDTGELLTGEIAEILDNIEQSVLGQNDRQYFIARDLSGNFLGFIGLASPNAEMRQHTKTPKPLEIINAYVDRSKAGHGTGRHLLKVVEKVATQAGYS